MAKLIIPLILYFFCFYALKKFIPFLKKISLVDEPSNRGNHNEVTPKGAGIILIPTIILSILLYFYFSNSLESKWLVFVISVSLLFSISLIDDIKNLPTLPRLSVHLICVVLSVFFFKEDIVNYLNNLDIKLFSNIHSYFIFYGFSFVVIFVWLWLINLFNFMDGMDGLTGLQMIFLGLITNFMSLTNQMSQNYQFLSLVILAVFLAFFRLNKPPAKIFLGDSGSIVCGYIAGFILLDTLISSGPFISLLIILLYFISDSTITLIIRIFKKKNIFTAHSGHFYQKSIRSGKSHKTVLNKIIILMLGLTTLSFFAIKFVYFSLILAILFSLTLLIYFNKNSEKNE